MKTRFLTSLSLVAILLAACAPAAATESPAQPAASIPVEPSGTPVAPAEATLEPPTEAAAAPTDAPVPTPLPVATSRGPELHATDPRTVSLASGDLQFVEFFRFT